MAAWRKPLRAHKLVCMGSAGGGENGGEEQGWGRDHRGIAKKKNKKGKKVAAAGPKPQFDFHFLDSQMPQRTLEGRSYRLRFTTVTLQDFTETSYFDRIGRQSAPTQNSKRSKS